MKHFLSKLTLLGIVSLIFVSCSKSPEQYVENCADYSEIEFLKEGIDYWKNIEEVSQPNKINEKQSSFDFEAWATGAEELPEETLKKAKKRLSEITSELKVFDELSIKKKLMKGFRYERYFEECSIKFKEDEITFKAKWK